MTHLKEIRNSFPEYDLDTLPPAIPEGWVDASYHNDCCPSFIAAEKGDERLMVWVDFAEPAHREFPDAKRYSVCLEREGEGTTEVFMTTDDWSRVLRFAAQFVFV